MRLLFSVLALSLVATACGGEDEDTAATLDCAWLADQNNCWRQTVRAAEGCVPTEQGVLAADRASCSWDDSAIIRFTPALPMDEEDVDTWNFTLEQGGQLCFKLNENYSAFSASFELTTAAGTAAYKFTRNSMEITCPGGERFRGSSSKILGCENLSKDSPGTAYWLTEDAARFALLDGQRSDGALEFHCVAAEEPITD